MISKYDSKFPLEVSKTLENTDTDIELQAGLKAKLKSHQLNLLKYFNPTTPVPGLVLYHGVGSGKTISSIAISKSFAETNDVFVFVPGSQLASNYKVEMRKTLLDDDFTRLEKKYKFIRYNGLTKTKLEVYTNSEILNDKLVIVDEAHNVVRMISNYLNDESNKIHVRGKGLYDLFTKSKNSRFLFLSATPILNTTKEIAVMLNLLAGKEKTIQCNLKKSAQTTKQIEETIRNFQFVDYVNVSKLRITVSKTPFGFFKSSDANLKFGNNAQLDDTMWVREFRNFMEENRYEIDIDTIKISDNELLPSNVDFEKTFVNKDFTLHNTDLLSRRISGLISSDSVKIMKSLDGPFAKPKTYTQRGYPKTIVNPVTKLGMSIDQFRQYLAERSKERQDDANRSRKSSRLADVLSDSGSMRARSGSICNFSFPIKIITNNTFTTETKRSVIVENMRSEFNEYLHGLDDNVIDTEFNRLSPKYHSILNHIMSNRGTSVVYSHLVHREGITSMFEMMIRKGFKKFDIYDDDDKLFGSAPKFALYGENKDHDENIRNIFNNNFSELSGDLKKRFEGKSNLKGEILKTLFITSSGAEGITLKNVRNLHIVEHHWSEIRIDQVIGRVSRFNSHAALPEEERIVEVHKYVTTFDGLENKFSDSTEVLEDLKKLKGHDRGKTTDEHILDVAYKKKKVADQMLTLIRNSSIDCSLNYSNTSQCRLEYMHVKNPIQFVPNFKENLNLNLKLLSSKNKDYDTEEKEEITLKPEIKIPKRKWIPVKFHGKTVFINKKSFEAYKKTGETYESCKFILNIKDKIFKILLD